MALKIWWYLEEAEAQYAFLVCKGLWLAQKKTAGCSSIVPGEVKEEKTSVIRVCILDCIRKLDFRLTNVTSTQGEHTQQWVWWRSAGLASAKANTREPASAISGATSPCWAHWYTCATASLQRQTKGSEVRPSKASPKHQVRHTADNITCQLGLCVLQLDRK